MAIAGAAIAGGVTVQRRLYLHGNRLGRGVQDRRIHVALDSHLAGGAARGVFQCHRPVHAQALRATCGELLQIWRVALAEQDQRRIAALQFARDAGEVGQRELPVHRRRQRAAPGVEDLECLRTCRVLRGEVGDDRIGDDAEQLVHCPRFVQGHRLDLAPVLAAAALDHVAGKRPRTAGKADQRDRGVQFAANRAHGIHDIAQLDVHVGYGEFRDVGHAADRALELRTLAIGEVQAKAHRVRHGQDVGKQDRGIQRKTAQRLQRHFTGQFRVLGQGQEAAGLRARRPVFRQVAAGLAHQPDRRAVDGFAAQGTQEATIEGRVVSGHVGIHQRGASAP